MIESMSREGTPEEFKAAQEFATKMLEAIPDDVQPDMLLGTLGILLQASFIKVVKREYRVKAFEDFAFTCRRAIVDDIRAQGGKP
jgi:hypothetical protein